MTNTNTPRRLQILTGCLVVAIGILGAEILVVAEPSLGAYLNPTFRGVPAESTVTTNNTAKRPVLKKQSKRAIRKTAKSGSTIIQRSISSDMYEKARCGDRLILLEEECDDGNVRAGDGCSAACKVETGYSCTTTQPSACHSLCGDGVIASDERCDDGNTNGDDGCSASCRVEFGYVCTGATSVCKIPAYCGNGTVETGETCDDDNASDGDGCSATCQTE